MRIVLQILLPVLVLGSAAFATVKIVASAKKPVVVPPAPRVAAVRVVAAQPTRLQTTVHSQGTVEAMTAVVLSAQVSGRVSAVSPNLRAGAFFAADEPLVSIDETDFRLNLVQMESAVARAELKLAQERAEAEVALRAWQQLEGERQADALATRKLFVTEAEAALAAAKAARERDEVDLQRTKLSLPFAGRVRRTSVDVGQFVAMGQALAEVYGIEAAEVRLPIPDEEAAFLELSRTPGEAARLPVRLTAEYAGRTFHWQGEIVRTEGEIDRRTRQVTLVARVASPFAGTNEVDRPPLAVGMFVEAEVEGRVYEDVFVLPREALRTGDKLFVLDGENNLRAREIAILRRDRKTVVVRGGLTAGERVCTSPLETFVDGMPVQVVVDPAQPDDKPMGEGDGR